MAPIRRSMRRLSESNDESSNLAAKRQKLNESPAIAYPCPVCKKNFGQQAKFWNHLSSEECGVNVFVCLGCGYSFSNDRQLRAHICANNDFGSINSDQRSALGVFSHVIVCEECAFFVPLIKNIKMSCWKNYSYLCAHASRSFRKITFYTWSSDIKNFDFSLPFNVQIVSGPSVTEAVPLACDKCGTQYKNVDDVERHLSESHPNDYEPMQCDRCSSEFVSPLRMELHINTEHGPKWDLVEFLKGKASENPFIENPPPNGGNALYSCDLCRKDFSADTFNQHDCAVNYMRRYLLNERIIFVHSATLTDCKIDLGNQDPMFKSFTQKTRRHLELCLQFDTLLVAPPIDDYMNDPIYSCRHCERVFFRPTSFRMHILETFQSQNIDFDWSRVVGGENDPLAYFGSKITVVEIGLMCPAPGCGSHWCSANGLQRHIGNLHADTFKALTLPPMVEKEVQPEPESLENACVDEPEVVDLLEEAEPNQEINDHSSDVMVDNSAPPSQVENGHSLDNDEDDDDDEVMVFEINTAASRSQDEKDGSIYMPSTLGRQKVHDCTHCSKKFYTQNALEEHLETHAHDAGLITDKILPVPAKMAVYICRNCCLAFELETDFVEHNDRHRLGCYDCRYCSATCLNPTVQETHLESHKKFKFVFGCVTCKTVYWNEIALMLHLHQVHNVELIWFCRLCNLGNTEWRRMENHACNGLAKDLPLFATVKRKLHFQPSSTGSKIKAPLDPQDVSQCCHRSFLSPMGGDCAVACTDCGTIMTYVAEQHTEHQERQNWSLVSEDAERKLIYDHQCSKRMKDIFRMPPKNRRLVFKEGSSESPPSRNGTVVAVTPQPPPQQRRDPGILTALKLAVNPPNAPQ